MEGIGFVVGAFFLFMLLLPLFGCLVGICLRILFPYLLGVVIALLVSSQLVELGLLSVCAIVVGWAGLMLTTRIWLGRLELQLSWVQGHYRSAGMVLSFGLLLKGSVDEVSSPLETLAPRQGS